MLRHDALAARSTSTVGRASLVLAALLAISCSAPSSASAPAGNASPSAATSASPSARPTSSPTSSPSVADNTALRGLGALAYVVDGRLFILTAERLIEIARGASDPQWSHDGAWIAFQVKTGTTEVWVARADGSDARRIDGLPRASTYTVAWAPSESMLAIAPFAPVGISGAGLWITAPDKAASVLAAAGQHVSSFAWSHDGTSLAYSASPRAAVGGLYTVPSHGGPSQELATIANAIFVIAAWWPNDRGMLIYRDPYGSGSVLADAVALESLQLTTNVTVSFPESLVQSPLWLPDGRRFVLLTGRGRFAWAAKTLQLCSLDTSACAPIHVPTGTVPMEPALSPDGARLTFSLAAERPAGGFASETEFDAWMRTRSLWITDASDLSGPRALPAAGSRASAPSWADSEHVAVLRDGSLWLINLRDNRSVEIVRGLPEAPPFGSGIELVWRRV